MARLLVCIAALVAGASAFAPPLSAVSRSARAAVVMEEKVAKKAKKEAPPPKPKLPGEGDPFSPEAQAYSEKMKDGLDAFVPRTISGEGVFMPSTYIEDEDEPWHSTCRSSNVLGTEKLASGIPTDVAERIAASPAKPGGDKPGWTDKRQLGITHDNSR